MVKKVENRLEDLSAERALLAGLCQYGLDVLLDVDFVNADYFRDSTNQIIFECVKQSIEDGGKVELSSILSKASGLGLVELLEKPEEVAFIRSLFNMVVHKSNIINYASKLAKLKIIRDIRKALLLCDGKLSDLTGNEEISNIMGIIEGPIQEAISEIYNTSSDKPVKMGEDVVEYLEHLKENQSDMVGIPTGFDMFDAAIGGGLRRKCVDVIGARMKVGKTLIAEQVGINISKRGIPVLMLDTEMDKKGHLNRILANLSSVTINNIQTGQFGDSEMDDEKVMKAAKELKNLPFSYINVSGKNFDAVLSIIRQWLYKEVGFNEDGSTKDCAIIYDYLKIMNSGDISDSMKEYQALGFQITQLHNFCVKYDLPCLTFVQLNRDGINKESTDVAADSDRILRYCTSFSIFKEKSQEEQADDRAAGLSIPYNRKIVVIISRYGSGFKDGDYLNLRMQGEYGRIVNGVTRNNLLKSGPEKNDLTPTDISTV